MPRTVTTVSSTITVYYHVLGDKTARVGKGNHTNSIDQMLGCRRGAQLSHARWIAFAATEDEVCEQ